MRTVRSRYLAPVSSAVVFGESVKGERQSLLLLQCGILPGMRDLSLDVAIRSRADQPRSSTARHISALLICIAALANLPAITAAASPDSAPPLPAPQGRIIRASSEADLQRAVAQLTSDTTILIEPGTYRLTHTLNIGGRTLRNVALRGATNNRDEVVLVGPGMASENPGDTPHGIWTGDGVDGVLIANLTVRDFPFHPIILNAGTSAPRIYNVRALDGGQQLLKGNPDGAGAGIEGGIVEYSIFEFTTTSRDSYTNGVDVIAGSNWVIRHNLFRNIRAPQGQLAGPSVLMWGGARNTIVEGNTFVNCQREIAFGLQPRTPVTDHSGGIIRNNFIYRDEWVAGDAGISVWDSPGTLVLHNTVILSGTYPNAIEFRFPGTVDVVVGNNLTDAAIVSRDEGMALITGNVTATGPSVFAAAVAGDLHLIGTAAVAVGRGTPLGGADLDWDGDVRPVEAPDVGADQRVPARLELERRRR